MNHLISIQNSLLLVYIISDEAGKNAKHIGSRSHVCLSVSVDEIIVCREIANFAAHFWGRI